MKSFFFVALCLASSLAFQPVLRRVRESDITSLTLINDELTVANRISPRPQVVCHGDACAKHAPRTVRCGNAGFDGLSVQWSCTADMDERLRFGKVEVTCEGFEKPGDEFVLAGSCAVEYELLGTIPEPPKVVPPLNNARVKEERHSGVGSRGPVGDRGAVGALGPVLGDRGAVGDDGQPGVFSRDGRRQTPLGNIVFLVSETLIFLLDAIVDAIPTIFLFGLVIGVFVWVIILMRNRSTPASSIPEPVFSSVPAPYPVAGVSVGEAPSAYGPDPRPAPIHIHAPPASHSPSVVHHHHHHDEVPFPPVPVFIPSTPYYTAPPAYGHCSGTPSTSTHTTVVVERPSPPAPRARSPSPVRPRTMEPPAREHSESKIVARTGFGKSGKSL